MYFVLMYIFQIDRVYASVHLQLLTISIPLTDLHPTHESSQSQSPSVCCLVEVTVDDRAGAFTYALRRNKLREVRQREGCYLLRTNLTSTDPAELWRYYIQLVQVEQAFKYLKGASKVSRSINAGIEIAIHSDEGRCVFFWRALAP